MKGLGSKSGYLGMPLLNFDYQYGCLTNAWKILLGASVRLLPLPRQMLENPSLAMLSALLLLLVAALNHTVLAFFGYRHEYLNILADPLVTMLSALVIVSSIGKQINPLLENRPLKAVARVSYSWYLWQWPLLDIIGWSRGYYNLIGGTSIAFIIAYFSTLYVEEPVTAFCRSRMTTCRSTTGMPLAGAIAGERS
jgi:peptidoglycan/LPS O-acetylase OafA/YrhL